MITEEDYGDLCNFEQPDFTKVLQGMSKSSGTDGNLFWLHVGISSNNSMIDKIMSASIISDYIYRKVMNGSSCPKFQNQIKNVIHPFSSMINTDYNALVMDKETMIKSKQLYEELRVKIDTTIGIKFDAYDTYLRKVNTAKIIFLRFTKMCLRSKLVDGSAKNVFGFIRWKSPVVVKMLEGKSKSFLANKTKVCDALSLHKYRTIEGIPLEAEEKSQQGNRKPKKRKRKKGLNFHKQTTHPNHKKSDDNINSRWAVTKIPKPGSINQLTDLISNCVDVLQDVKDKLDIWSETDEHIFGGISQPINSIIDSPVIVIETFTDNNGKIVNGIGHHDKNTSPGELYMKEDTYNNKWLNNVTICATTSSYFYVFSEAEKNPHFVLCKSEELKY